MALGRFDEAGSTYHVIQKAVAGARIFSESAARQFYLERLGFIAKQEMAMVLVFAVMDTHVHLVLYVRNSLERLMRRIGTSYGIYYNRRHARKGHVFGQKYFSRDIGDQEDFRRTSRYLYLNPAKAGMHSTIDDLMRSDRTNFPAMFGRPSPFAFDASIALQYFGDDPVAARLELERYVVLPDDDFRPEFREVQTGAGQEEVKRRLEARRHAQNEEARQAVLVARGWTLERIAAHVSEHFGISKERVLEVSKKPPLPAVRASIAWIASHDLGIPLVRIAEWYGTNPSTVQRSLERGKQLVLERAIDLDATSQIPTSPKGGPDREMQSHD